MVKTEKFPTSLPVQWKLWLWEGRVYLGKGRSCHLDPALVRGVDLEIVAESAVETQQPTAGETCVVT